MHFTERSAGMIGSCRSCNPTTPTRRRTQGAPRDQHDAREAATIVAAAGCLFAHWANADRPPGGRRPTAVRVHDADPVEVLHHSVPDRYVSDDSYGQPTSHPSIARYVINQPLTSAETILRTPAAYGARTPPSLRAHP